MAQDTSPQDRRGLIVLSTAECFDRIRRQPIGRVGFVHDGEVVILPVNHIVRREQIAFQTSWGSKLQVAADQGPMTFEVDGHDASRSWGWSVLVQGVGSIVHDREERERLEAQHPLTWVTAAANMFWVVITPKRVSGREVHHGRL
jgi:nitroimidazol reductase NimA-like FMN-containing flavoprotein (pyridoxamine 5'-phosphate oxidase superfamily)